MNDQTMDGGSGEIDHIEELLREMNSQDSELIEPPADLWDSIEAQVRQSGDQTNVVALDRRRRFSPKITAIVSVAAAAVIIVAGVTVVSQRDGSSSTVVASADLAYDPVNFDKLGANAAAHVSLVDDDGELLVEIDKSDLPNPVGESADLELWLIEPDADGNPAQLVSLGFIDPERPGDFVVPTGYDPDVYSVVDISVEPRDGDSSHSGRSILRGRLTEA